MITNLQDFYRSKEWERFVRILAMERADENGVITCAHCGKPIIYKYDRIAHHKTHLTLGNVNDVNIALNPENIALVHHRCHNEIHERFGFQKPQEYRPKKVYIVHGSPCSGKSTYTASVAGPADIVMDMDAIWNCISAAEGGGGFHASREPKLKQVAFGVRNCILDMIRTRNGDWDNAYIIGTYPRQSDRERMAAIYGAEMVHIDTPRDICELRAQERPKEWRQYVSEYWEQFQQQGEPEGYPMTLHS